jgi:hypothetical protein
MQCLDITAVESVRLHFVANWQRCPPDSGAMMPKHHFSGLTKASGSPLRDRAAIPYLRRFLLGLGARGKSAWVQKSAVAFVLLLIRRVVSRLAWAVAFARAAPPTAFAPLSHMLRKGFFFVQGFFIASSFHMVNMVGQAWHEKVLC